MFSVFFNNFWKHWNISIKFSTQKFLEPSYSNIFINLLPHECGAIHSFSSRFTTSYFFLPPCLFFWPTKYLFLWYFGNKSVYRGEVTTITVFEVLPIYYCNAQHLFKNHNISSRYWLKMDEIQTINFCLVFGKLRDCHYDHVCFLLLFFKYCFSCQ